MAARTHEAKRKTLAAMSRLGDAGPKAIAAEMGPEWLEPKKFACFVQMLRGMVRSHLVLSVGRGKYRVSPSCSWRGFDARDEMRMAIGKLLREYGGVARTRDIHEGVTDRRLWGRGDRDYIYRLITQTLKACFRQDLGRGYWNLTPDEMAQVPLLGWIADNHIQLGWFENGDRGQYASWEDKRDAFFRSVGAGFKEARGDRNASDVAAQADIVSALNEMERKCPTARMEALEALRDEVTKEALADGLTDRWTIESEVRARKEMDLGVHLYEMFEQGNTELHLAASVEFYRACALVFGVCPVRLSRGEVVAHLSESVFVPIPAATAPAFGGEA